MRLTIEAVGAKTALPRARALQTPAAFSPTPESTEFVPFCSLSPPLICRGPQLHPLQRLGRDLGPWFQNHRGRHFSVSHLLSRAIILIQCQAGSLSASKSSGHFLQWRKRMIMAQEWNSNSWLSLYGSHPSPQWGADREIKLIQCFEF